ncbi:MAG: hypothetical protein ACE5H1_06550 [Thermodesulfobacteriota bacterium]
MQKRRLELPSSKEIYKQIIKHIEKERTFLLFTGKSIDSIIESSNYAHEKGFNLIGIDFKTPKLKDYLKSLKKKQQRKFGVFSIASRKEARIAINAGATFIFSTHMDRGIIRFCKKENIFNSIGSLTPTEVSSAKQFSANSISLFPCSRLGGLDWFIFLRGIFAKTDFIPTDFMTPLEAAQYLNRGAYSVAPIIDLEKTKNPDEIVEEFLSIK